MSDVTPLDRVLAEAERRKWKDADLCRHLRITQQRLNNWKSRGLPIDASVLISQRLNLSLDYIVFGKKHASRSPEPARANEPLTLYSTTPDRQTRLLDLFDQLLPEQQDRFLLELEAAAKANLAVAKHFAGRRFRGTADERIEATYGVPINTTKGS